MIKITTFISSTLLFTIFSICELRADPPATWSFKSQTGHEASVIVPVLIGATVNGRDLQTGDVVGVFYKRNDTLMCAGYSVWDGMNMAITAWGDNELTPEKDGFANFEQIIFKVWDAVALKEITAEVTFLQGSGTFSADGILILSGLIAKEDPSAVNEKVDISQNLQISSIFNVNRDEIAVNITNLSNEISRLSLFNLNGNLMYETTLPIVSETENQTIINVEKITSGAYFLRLSNSKISISQKLLIAK